MQVSAADLIIAVVHFSRLMDDYKGIPGIFNSRYTLQLRSDRAAAAAYRSKEQL